MGRAWSEGSTHCKQSGMNVGTIWYLYSMG